MLCSQRQLQADSTRIFRYQYELEEGESVSAAEFIEDVNKDTTVIIDGLTKVCIWLPMRMGCLCRESRTGAFPDGASAGSSDRSRSSPRSRRLVDPSTEAVRLKLVHTFPRNLLTSRPANHVLQVAALPFLELERVKQDRIALQRHFKFKRDRCLARLENMGLKVHVPPTATFYVRSPHFVDLGWTEQPLRRSGSISASYPRR